MSIITKVHRKLSERRGDGQLIRALALTAAIVLVVVILAELWRMVIIVEGVDSNVERAVLATATSNAYVAFGGVREGNSSIYLGDGGAYIPRVDISDIEGFLIRNLALSLDGHTLTRYTAYGQEIVISNLSVTVENPTYNAVFGDSAIFTSTYTVRIPLYFLKDLNLGITITRTTRTKWQPLF